VSVDVEGDVGGTEIVDLYVYQYCVLIKVTKNVKLLTVYCEAFQQMKFLLALETSDLY